MTETHIPKPEELKAQEQDPLLKFKDTTLEWVNFAERLPDLDRWILIYSPMGNLHPNFIVTYRDASGNYQFPHPTKQYIVRAWAYLYNPTPETNLESHD